MNHDSDEHFMAMALAEAEAGAAEGQTPFGAVVVNGAGEVVGSGHNRVRADRDPTAHGEMVALRDAWRRLGTRERLAECTVYTSCEPCLMCSYVLTQFRLRRVVYAARGTDVPAYRPLLDADLSAVAGWVGRQSDWSPIEVRGDLLRERAVAVLRAFDWG
ncbi:nucleoside deaminase [Methylobacterium crusticola]|nr:nucleoside deaminase [Methylobacterium crusticola]